MKSNSVYLESLESAQLGLYDYMDEYRQAVADIRGLGFSPEDDRILELLNVRALSYILLSENNGNLNNMLVILLAELNNSLLRDILKKFENFDGAVMDVFKESTLDINENLTGCLSEICDKVSGLCNDVNGRLFPQRTSKALFGDYEDHDLKLLSLPVSERNFFLSLVLRQFTMTYIDYIEGNFDKIKDLKFYILKANIDHYANWFELTDVEKEYISVLKRGGNVQVLHKSQVDHGYKVIGDLLSYLEKSGLELSKIFLIGEQISYFTKKHDLVVLFCIIGNSIVDFEDQMICAGKNTEEYNHWKDCKILLDRIRSVLKQGGLKKRRRKKR